MPEPRVIVTPRQLVVEGRDAEIFFNAFLRQMGLAGIQVQNFGGKDELRGFLKALRVTPGFPRVVSLGIVRDAERDPMAAFQSVCSALRNAGMAVPQQPLMKEEGSPRVSALILPDATTAGALETICLEAVADDPVMQCVKDYFECVRQRMGSLPENLSKAQLHAFLASRPKPDLLLGQAANAGYWPWNSPAFRDMIQFLQSL